MTPSAAHDQAYRREDGHDEMQLQVHQLLTEIRVPLKGPRIACENFFSHIEYPFESGGVVKGFADVVAEFGVARDGRREGTDQTFQIFEIKPIIYSAGAVIRQCRVLESMARWVLHDEHGRRQKFSVVPVVQWNDPLFDILEAMSPYPVLAWDMHAAAPRDCS